MKVTSTPVSEETSEAPPRRGHVDLSSWAYFFSDPLDQAKTDWWMAYGKCFKDSATTEYFVPDDQSVREARRRTAIAKSICNGTDGSPPCQVRGMCASYAIVNEIWEGVWGGMSKRERRLALRQGNRLLAVAVVSFRPRNRIG
jgi:hypothetical protein